MSMSMKHAINYDIRLLAVEDMQFSEKYDNGFVKIRYAREVIFEN